MAELSKDERDRMAVTIERIAEELKETAYYFRRDEAPNARRNLYNWGKDLESLSDKL